MVGTTSGVAAVWLALHIEQRTVWTNGRGALAPWPADRVEASRRDIVRKLQAARRGALLPVARCNMVRNRHKVYFGVFRGSCGRIGSWRSYTWYQLATFASLQKRYTRILTLPSEV